VGFFVAVSVLLRSVHTPAWLQQQHVQDASTAVSVGVKDSIGRVTVALC
jgi:hypothetical protein